MKFKADIGVIGAMEPEVKALIEKMRKPKRITVSGVEFCLGRLHGKRVVIARCGVGKVFAALCCEAMILNFSPKLIINTGVGGAVNESLKQGDVVIATSLVQHDMDTSPLGDPKGMISGIDVVYFNSDRRAVQILESLASSLEIPVSKGTVATGDKFIAKAQDRAALRQGFNADCCEMEGAAIAHVSYVNTTPFVVVRAISDTAGGQAQEEYSTFLPKAAERSSTLTSLLIKNY